MIGVAISYFMSMATGYVVGMQNPLNLDEDNAQIVAFASALLPPLAAVLAIYIIFENMGKSNE